MHTILSPNYYLIPHDYCLLVMYAFLNVHTALRLSIGGSGGLTNRRSLLRYQAYNRRL
jgi:hypothetical protein